MSFSSNLFAALEQGNQINILTALTLTRKPIVVYDEEMFRDSPPVITGGAALSSALDLEVMTIAGGVEQTVTEEDAGLSLYSLKGPSSTLEDDSYKHVPKRYIPKLATLIEYWDALTVGLAMTMSVTTTSGSTALTVPNNEVLTPGQAITGTGIPAGTTILQTIPVPLNGVIIFTSAVMSQAATASGTVTATLTGANKVGEIMQAEFIGWGASISTPT